MNCGRDQGLPRGPVPVRRVRRPHRPGSNELLMERMKKTGVQPDGPSGQSGEQAERRIDELHRDTLHDAWH